MPRFLLIVFMILLGPSVQAACDGASGFWSLPGDEQRRLQDRADRAPYPEGILWQVEKDGTVSFVFGTMHLPDPRHADNMARLEPLLDRTEQVFLEMSSSEDAAFKEYLASNPQLILLTEGPSLIDLLGEDAWQRLLPSIKAHGLPGFVAAKYQPWFLGLTLSIPTCAIEDLRKNKLGVDRMVENAAQARKLPVRSLDDAPAMLRSLGGDPLEKQVADLKWSLKFGLSENLSGGADLPDHYFREQVQLGWEYLHDEAQRQVGEDPEDRNRILALLGEMEDALINGRNGDWVEILSGELAETPSFVAVGAMHLPGENGILALLRGHGFEITRLPLAEGLNRP